MSLSFRSFFGRPDVFLITASTIIIVIAIAISGVVQSQGQNGNSFSQVITVGPVWPDNNWVCTSDANFMVHGTIRALADAQLSIDITDTGAQSLYTFEPSNLYSFSVGAQADQNITLTRTGTITGFITLQTTSDATASCT